MPWGRHDDKFWRHPKVRALRKTQQGLAALGLRSVMHSACLDDPELDGRIHAEELRPADLKLARVLVDAGLWDDTAGGFQMHDYSDYNPTKAGLSKLRKQSRDTSQKHRDTSRDASQVGHDNVTSPRASAWPTRGGRMGRTQPAR